MRGIVALSAGVSLAALTAGPAAAAPLIGVVVAAAGLTGFAATATTAILSLAVGVGLSFAASALATKKPKTGAAPERPGQNISQKESIGARRLVYGRTRLGGTIVHMSTHQQNSWLYIVIALCEGEIDAVEGIYLDAEYPTTDVNGQVTTGTFATRCYNWRQTGTGSDTPPAFFTTRTDGQWTSAHTLTGVAALFVAFEWDTDGTYKNGLPNISALVRGLKVYDPRSGLTAYSNNAALCIRDYLLRAKEKGGLGLTSAEVDDDNFIAQANICDETVTTNDGTVPRYTLNGIIELDEGTTPGDVIDQMLTSCQGRLVWSGGKMRLFVGAWRASSFTITDDMIIGAPTVTTRQSMAQQFNAVKGTYRSEAARWESTDFKAITSSIFEAEDGGDRIFRDLTLPFTTDNATAQRLAKMELYRAREPMEVTLPCNLLAYRVAVGDVVGVTHARWGWTAKTFEVTGWKWSVTDSDTGPSLGVDLTLRESSAAAYSWSASEESLLAANPGTSLPNWNNPGPPTALAVTEELYETTGSAGVKSRAILSWTAAADGFVDSYEEQYKLSTSSTWLNLPNSTGTEITLPDLAPGVYNFRVRSVNVLRAKSTYVQITQTITGLASPPAAPSNLRLAIVGGVGILSWAQTTDLDVKIGGAVLVNHTPQTSSVTWENSAAAADPLPGDATQVIVPVRAGTYLVRFRDSSGVLSTTYPTIAADQASAITYNTLSTLTEAPSFSGTKTNCAFDGTGLSITTPASPATYLFSANMDLGSVKNVRLTTICDAVTYSSSDLWDSRVGNIDSWVQIDGPTGGGVDAIVYYRSTQTDPAGSPTWTSWQPITVTDVRARGFQFKLEFEADDPTWNVRILTLTAKAEEPA